MPKSIVFTAGGKSVILPIKPLIAVEAALTVATLSLGFGIGALFGHPFIGFGVGAGLVTIMELAEFLIAQKAIKSLSLIHI